MRRIGSTPSGSDVSEVPACDPQVLDMRLTAVRPPLEVVGFAQKLFNRKSNHLHLHLDI